MPKLLYAWEYGGGLGHLARAKSLITALNIRGVETIFASKFAQADSAVSPIADVITAPTVISTIPDKQNRCYAELMLNNGYNDVNNLIRAILEWKTIFVEHKIEAIVADFSPTSILAAHGNPQIKRFCIGTGFCCPRYGIEDLKLFVEWPVTNEEIAHSNIRLLDSINEALRAVGSPVLSQWSDLSQCDESFLTTFEELDHFPDSSSSSKYIGPLMSSEGVTPMWSSERSPKAFVYLKQHESLHWILDYLAKVRINVLVHVDGVSPLFYKPFVRETFSFCLNQLDIRKVCHECDFAICNAGHGVVAEMLLAGKPLVCLPLVLEQAILAERMVKQGFGTFGHLLKRETVIESIRSMHFNVDSYKKQTRQFADKYAGYSSSDTLAKIIKSIEEHLSF